MEQLIKIAASQLGVREIPGDEDNPVIVNYAKETGIAGISNDEVLCYFYKKIKLCQI